MPNPSDPCLFINLSVSKPNPWLDLQSSPQLLRATVSHHTSSTLSLSPLFLSAQPWPSLYGQLQELAATRHHHLHGGGLPLFLFYFSSNHGRKFLPLCCILIDFCDWVWSFERWGFWDGYLQIQGLVVVVDFKMGIAIGVSLWVAVCVCPVFMYECESEHV